MSAPVTLPQPFVPDYEKIVGEIVNLDVNPLSRESGASLVEYWVGRNAARDSAREVLAVECGFTLWVDERTCVIGVQDLLTRERGIVVGNEWKTTKEKTRYWNEDTWRREIGDGSQIAIYALALNRGLYFERENESEPFFPSVERPRIRVRAVSKSEPPVCWPTDEADEMVEFSPEDLAAVANGIRAKAEGIRAMRALGLLPWQLPGKQCHVFNRACEFLEECRRRHYPALMGTFDPEDPAYALALPHIYARREQMQDENVVILSASSYETASTCAEKYRRVSAGVKTEESMALDIGTTLHAGVGELYRQMREWQRNGAVGNGR